MRQRISVNDLRLGMFLDGMDASWEKTPFLTDRFLIKSEEQINKLKHASILHVFIDTERSKVLEGKTDVSKEIDKIKFLKKEEILDSPGPVEMDEAVLFKKGTGQLNADGLPYTKEDLNKFYNEFNNYTHIDKTTLVVGTYINFPLYVKRDLQILQLVIFKNKEIAVTDEMIAIEGDFMIHSNDKLKYKGYLTELMNIKTSNGSSEIIRNRVVKENSKLLMEELLADPRSGEKIKECQQNIDAIISTMQGNNSLTNGLFTINKSDYYTYTHCVNVSVLAVGLAISLGMNKQSEIFALAMGAMLHDIGKCKIPPSILNKPTKLTEDEFRIMKSHVLIGKKLLSVHPNISKETLHSLTEHHEKMTGKGYPYGLSAEELHFAGKVVAMADVYDALTTARPYKKAFGSFEALSIIRSQIDDYDKEIFLSFVKMLGN
ncbi:HD-GYP domain-containing protein [Candidatus Magnetomonas plexicatena]|uniref:HD-GYP domain-containing protein n=1 Tax=Candidatus Magnetomonas plexicatena TaxID=2552947 RepID=UPI001C752CC7|nr:DUF3391 domain-containing protein [Nitrospirales bacterium LBB_01]